MDQALSGLSPTPEVAEGRDSRRQIVRRSKSYVTLDNQLYERSATGVFQKCVSQQDGIEILQEIHLGDCGHHAAPGSLVAKALRLGFYWLTSKADADKLVENYH